MRYTLDTSDVDVMIELGVIYQFIHKHTGMAFTYSDWYLSKGNPYGLKRLAPQVTMADANGQKTSRQGDAGSSIVCVVFLMSSAS